MARRIILMDAVAQRTIDISDFARKSDIPTMPDTSDFARKSDIPTMPDTSDFARKSDIPTMPDTSDFAKKTDVTAQINSAKGEIVVDETVRNQFIKDVMNNADNQIGARLGGLEGKMNDHDDKINNLEPRVRDCENDLEIQSKINNSLKESGFLRNAQISVFIKPSETIKIQLDGQPIYLSSNMMEDPNNTEPVLLTVGGVAYSYFGNTNAAYLKEYENMFNCLLVQNGGADEFVFSYWQ